MTFLYHIAQRAKASPFILIFVALATGIVMPILPLVLLPLCIFRRFRLLRLYLVVGLVGAVIVFAYKKPPPPTPSIHSSQLIVTKAFNERNYGCKIDGSDYHVALELDSPFRLIEGDMALGTFIFEEIDNIYISSKSFRHSMQLEGYSAVARPYMDVVYVTPPRNLTWWQKWQQWAVHRLSTAQLSSQNIAILTALVTGHRELESDSASLYKRAGIMHLLAVSGLHVGIIAYIITLALSLVLSAGRFALHRLIITITLLVIYALFTGMSVSVVRAVIMFSVILIASHINYGSPISYNALAFAAVVITLFWPAALLDIGFRLSFVAVLSILYFAPKILKRLNFGNRATRYIISLLVVTIAAQIMILPLQVYYFRAISLVGIFNNLVALSLVPFIIVLGFVYLALPLSVISTPIGWMLDIIEYSSRASLKLPYSYVYGVELSATGLVVSYVIIGLVVLFIEYRAYRKLQA